jgi:vanillin dehydrogenase
MLEKAAQLLGERGADIAALMAAEIGAVVAWCEFNVDVAVGMLREAAAQTYSMLGDLIRCARRDGVGRSPTGQRYGRIAPWNAPVILGVRAVAMPLTYGNTVILKASEQATAAQAEIGRRRRSRKGSTGGQGFAAALVAAGARNGPRFADIPTPPRRAWLG